VTSSHNEGPVRVDAVEKVGRESCWGLAVGLVWQV